MKPLVAVLSLFTILVLSSATVSAQIRKIPSTVTESFKEKYPSASKVEWRDKVSAFAAVFEDDGTKYEARFNSKGGWIETESQVSEDAIPDAVKEGIEKSKYAEWTIGDAHKIELPGDEIQYRVQVVKTDVQKKNLVFSEKGRLLKDRVTL